jgi:hypothetical protein
MICGVAIDLVIPNSIKPFIRFMELSKSGEPSSIPGRICEWISVLKGKYPLCSDEDSFLKKGNIFFYKTFFIFNNNLINQICIGKI